MYAIILSFLLVVFPFYKTQTAPEGDFLFTECNTNKQEFEYYIFLFALYWNSTLKNSIDYTIL